ncbi:MAG: histidine phosphatase family protein [Deltaproteobacteria bacterium]|nr:histidine phosphatase family protein [Deltaproteobacteria bacterium]
MAATRLFLVRHGEVEGDGVLHGHVDVPLTARGLAQAEAVAARLTGEPLAAVYCSDLQRARFGAECVARGTGLTPVADPAFRELDMGAWDGRPFLELLETDRDRFANWWADLERYVLPGGESLAQLRDRVLPALRGLLGRHAGETVCLVAHGGVNRVILFDALGLPLSHYHRLAQDYGCLNLLEVHADGPCVVKLVNG